MAMAVVAVVVSLRVWMVEVVRRTEETSPGASASPEMSPATSTRRCAVVNARVGRA